jgi:hypothetical protein
MLCRAHVVLTQELQQVLIVVPCTPLEVDVTWMLWIRISGTERRYFGV